MGLTIVQGALDARAAIERLRDDKRASSQKSSTFQWRADLAAAYDALGAALLAESEHMHQDPAGAVKVRCLPLPVTRITSSQDCWSS